MNFPAYSAATTKNTTGMTFKAKFERKQDSGWRRLVVPVERCQAVSRARVEALLLVDAGLADLLYLASIDSASLLTTALQERVTHHEQALSPSALSTWHPEPALPHLVSSDPARAKPKPAQASQPPPPPPSNRNKIAALYNLYLTSYRMTRRRILGLLNYMHVATRWVSGLYALLAHPQAAPRAATGVNARGAVELGRWRHSFFADEDGVLHCRNQDQVALVYEEALEELGRVEDRLLRLATHAVKEHEGGSGANLLSVLHDLLQCEAAFLEAKLRHVSLLLDALEHTCDPHPLALLLHRIYRALQVSRARKMREGG